MRRHAFLSLIPAALLALAGCTEHESPTSIAAPIAVSQQFLLAPATSPGTIVAWGADRSGEVSDIPPGNDFIAVAGGGGHGVALREGGSLVSWGWDLFGQSSGTPSGNEFVAVAAGFGYSIALRENGSLLAWGRNEFGQVSDVPPGNDFVAVAAGAEHVIALRENGSLVSWGWDAHDQVTATPSGDDFAAVAAGTYHSTALRADGSLVSWGNNELDNRAVSETPSGTDFAAVAAGAVHGTALRTDGSLVHWGQVSGAPPPGNDFVAVSAGGSHNVALREDGSLVSWGSDSDSQVSGTPSGTDFVAVAGGGSSSYAIRRSPADELAPAINITSPADGAIYLLGQVVIADYSCTDEDGGSGLASCTGTAASGETINTAQVGANTFVVDAADEAGNTATLTHNYTVAYDFSGFGAPVQDDGTLNVVRAGRTVPLTWRLMDASGQPITDLSGVNVAVEDIACELGGTADVLEESASGASGLQNLDNGYYQFNWKTPRSYASSCKTLHLDLGDGLTRTAMFRFTK